VSDTNPAAGIVEVTLLSSGLSAGDFVTATASDGLNGTSEFAVNMVVPALLSCQVTTTADSGAGSLRECINFANSNAGTTISFNIPLPTNQSSGGDSWWRISPSSALPTITAAGTIIDGTTQTANQGDTNTLGPEIEIEGSGAGAGVNGLLVTGGTSTIRGLVINSFTDDGIELSTNGSNSIEGNYIGIDAIGAVDLGNGQMGIRIASGDNTIGGNSVSVRNVVSGNSGYGITLSGLSASNNTIRGNYIGTDRSGTSDLGNTFGGVWIGSSASPRGTSSGATLSVPMCRESRIWARICTAC
jgi:hypothetical protein